jgi:hypothetical protein
VAEDEPGPFVPLPRRPSEEVRKKALAEPGPTWTEWFYASFLKVWIPLGFLIVDVWAVGYFLEAGVLWAAGAVVPVALYLNFVGWCYLYAHPGGDRSRSVRSDFHPTPIRPFEWGRWTPEGTRVRRGLPPYEGPRPEDAPDPAEFF